MKSMTGYGRGECVENNRRFIFEIKAVNHRYNDINIKLPRVLIKYEDAIKKKITESVFRGKIDVFVTFETFSVEDVNVKVNEALADNYINALQGLRERYSLKDDITLSLVAKFPDLITVDKSINENEDDEIKSCLDKALQQAIDNFVAMRIAEGESLKRDILLKTDIIAENVEKIVELAPLVEKNYKQRLTEKLSELKELNIEESRIVTEVAIFAEKACIDEEITRLKSHIVQLRSILEENVPVGRKLDFLVQEMNREVNTIGSKSNDLDITNTIVFLKSEIEKIREQIQNIE